MASATWTIESASSLSTDRKWEVSEGPPSELTWFWYRVTLVDRRKSWWTRLEEGGEGGGAPTRFVGEMEDEGAPVSHAVPPPLRTNS